MDARSRSLGLRSGPPPAFGVHRFSTKEIVSVPPIKGTFGRFLFDGALFPDVGFGRLKQENSQITRTSLVGIEKTNIQYEAVKLFPSRLFSRRK